MRRWAYDAQFAIGLTSTTMNRLIDAGVPVPDQVTMGFSNYYVLADGTRVGDGYLQCVWVWDVLSRESLYALLNPLGLTVATTRSVSVFIHTDTRDGLDPLPVQGFRTYEAIMYVPVLSGQEGVSITRSPYNYQSVKVSFNRLQEVV